MSQAELAGDQLSVSYVSHLESGRREPTTWVVEHCERRLGRERGTLTGAVVGGRRVPARGGRLPRGGGRAGGAGAALGPGVADGCRARGPGGLRRRRRPRGRPGPA
ncbi:helix-turn-helix domain-containing protein [Arsenicicoccus sp. oral taxon 190]|uniref:helix-turn-helix domain-containing protein n=1 Tax=Arsenicicoccus sp. oral taxon 190 TaxID=1658671 RepID=UPI003460A378